MWAWRRGLGQPLRTTDGETLHVVYRGRCPGGAGPDVRGALLAFGGGRLIEGDVEFHRKTSDWFAHGHHRDRHYAAVALHVVLVDDAAAPPGPDGKPLPTLVVPEADLAETTGNRGEESVETCHRVARERGTAVLGAALDALGDRRLAQRAARFESDLSRLGPEALAQEALFDALGFSRNRAPFVRLAQAVPIGLLSALLGRRPLGEAITLAEAILFGVAGLLPSQRPAARLDWEAAALAAELEDVWALYRRDWEGFGLDLADWTFGGVRPANCPPRRVATAARLIARYREEGLDGVLLGPLRAGPADAASLERLFLVDEPAGYWATHADFGHRLPGPPAALLGRDRARDAAINVVFPLALAIAARSDDHALADAAWATFRAFPRPAAYEATRRLATGLGMPERLVTSARRQQGLLHLLRNHCDRVECVACPLASRETRE